MSRRSSEQGKTSERYGKYTQFVPNLALRLIKNPLLRENFNYRLEKITNLISLLQESQKNVSLTELLRSENWEDELLMYIDEAYEESKIIAVDYKQPFIDITSSRDNQNIHYINAGIQDALVTEDFIKRKIR